jgi:hypothetical protein
MTKESKMTTRVQAELPPRVGGVRPGRVDWAAAKKLIMDNEGMWVLAVENVANTTPQQLRSGRYQAFRKEDLPNFEFAVRRPEDPAEPYGPRRADLWGRYTK